MKTNIYLTRGLILFLSLALGVWGCNSDNDPKVDPPEPPEPGVITISADELIFERQSDTKTIDVTTEVDWKVESDLNWVEPLRDGNKLVVTVKENETEEIRDGIITLTGDDATPVEIKIVQKYSIFSLSKDEVSFRWKDAEEEIIEVYYLNDAWVVEPTSENWHTAIKQDDGTILINAEDNDTNQVRETTITLSEGAETTTISIKQKKSSDVKVIRQYTQGIMTAGLSSNGRYAYGHNSPKGAWFWDLETDEFISFGENVACYRASDDGVIVGCVDSYPKYYKNGSWHTFDLSALGSGSLPSSFIGIATSITPDGSTVTGVLANAGSDYKYSIPVVWRNGYDKPFEFLENPDLDIIEDPSQGARAMNVSPDGSIILGEQVTRFSQYIAAMWNPGIRMIAPEKYYITERRGNKTLLGYPSINGFSPDGKWAHGCYQGLVMDEDTGALLHEEYVPFIYDVNTHQLRSREFATIINDLSDPQITWITGVALISDLTQIYLSPGGAASMEPVTWMLNDTEKLSFEEWFLREHNFELDNPYIAIRGVSDDLKTWIGYEVEAFLNFSAICIRIED